MKKLITAGLCVTAMATVMLAQAAQASDPGLKLNVGTSTDPRWDAAVEAVELKTFTPSEDEPRGIKKMGLKVLHITKKALFLPVYLIGGAGLGIVAGGASWYYFGGEEGDLSRALKGGS